MGIKTSLAKEDGIAILEVLIASVVIGIAVIGLALMFSSGQTFVFGEGTERVGLYLAEQRMEELRTQGVDSITLGNCTEGTNISVGTCTEPTGTILGFPGFRRVTVVTALADPDGSGTADSRQIEITVNSSVRQADPVIVRGILFNH